MVSAREHAQLGDGLQAEVLVERRGLFLGEQQDEHLEAVVVVEQLLDILHGGEVGDDRQRVLADVGVVLDPQQLHHADREGVLDPRVDGGRRLRQVAQAGEALADGLVAAGGGLQQVDQRGGQVDGARLAEELVVDEEEGEGLQRGAADDVFLVVEHLGEGAEAADALEEGDGGRDAGEVGQDKDALADEERGGLWAHDEHEEVREEAALDDGARVVGGLGELG